MWGWGAETPRGRAPARAAPRGRAQALAPSDFARLPPFPEGCFGPARRPRSFFQALLRLGWLSRHFPKHTCFQVQWRILWQGVRKMRRCVCPITPCIHSGTCSGAFGSKNAQKPPDCVTNPRQFLKRSPRPRTRSKRYQLSP